MRHLTESLGSRCEREALNGVTGQVLLDDVYWAGLRFASHKQWPTMLLRMNGKQSRMWSTTGISAHARQLNLIREDLSMKRSRGRGEPKLAAEGEAFVLGKNPKRYVATGDTTSAVRVLDHLLEEGDRFEAKWPTAAGEVLPFLDALLAFSKKVRSYRDDSHVSWAAWTERKGTTCATSVGTYCSPLRRRPRPRTGALTCPSVTRSYARLSCAVPSVTS